MADRHDIAGSTRTAPDAARTGPCDPAEPAEVSVYLKASREPPPAGAFHNRDALRQSRAETLKSAFQRLTTFAAAHGLTVSEQDPARRRVRLAGPVRAMESAFGVQLHRYAPAGGAGFRARTGAISVPANMAEDIEAVLGLDQRPIATPKLRRLADPAAAVQSYAPNQVAKLYGFPDVSGQGETVGIIELGGGFRDSDTQTAFQAMGLTPPQVTAVSVSGGSNQPGKDTDADGEVALDIQVAGGAAPGAAYAVYFAANTDQGFVDAISQAAHDATHTLSTLSISWGSAESAWTGQAVTAMTSALQDAVDLGLSVFAASGDGLAADGVSDGKAHVDFPASSPLVVGCGGVRLEASGATITGETVWNSEGGGTGGGISVLFPVPTYQADVKLPAAVGGGAAGRGVPDVAADADPQTGYQVVVDGQNQVIGGTSAAAPLWAGLFALVNQQAGKPSGQPHAILYANPTAFRDITQGDNRSGGVGYAATKGWDACTGLGAPDGTAIAQLFTR